MHRRDLLRASFALAVTPRSLLGRAFESFVQAPLIEKAIPSSGEKIPVIGLGTARYWDAVSPELTDVIRRFAEGGGKVIDTAPSYGNAERVAGEIVESLRARDKYFIATKVNQRSGERTAILAQMEESLRRLRVPRVDLMQVHNLSAVDQALPMVREWKAAGKTRYVGVTTSFDAQYDAFEHLMRREQLDFVQIDYAIDNRGAAEKLLPLAAERGMAVLVNSPFGRGRAFRRVQGRELPGFAADFGATTWAQLFLKYLASHPAVTCVIPGMERVTYLVDDMAASRGTLPDAAMRKRIEDYFDALPA